MPVKFTVTFELPRSMTATLGAMQAPKLNDAIAAGLLRSAFKVQDIATRKHLRGPRPQKLDVITGELRRSIAVDRTELPKAISVGTDLVYGEVHEFGGSFQIKTHTRRNRRSTGTHRVRSHNRKVPARPFLQPAFEEASRDFERYFLEEWSKRVFGS